MVEISIEKVALWAAIVAGLGILVWLIYVIWQHAKLQKAMEKQDKLLATAAKQGQLSDNINYRMRNIGKTDPDPKPNKLKRVYEF